MRILVADKLPEHFGATMGAGGHTSVMDPGLTRDTLPGAVASWGHPVVGRTSRPHRHPALSYKAFWVEA